MHSKNYPTASCLYNLSVNSVKKESLCYLESLHANSKTRSNAPCQYSNCLQAYWISFFTPTHHQNQLRKKKNPPNGLLEVSRLKTDKIVKNFPGEKKKEKGKIIYQTLLMGCHICTSLTYRTRLSGTVERVG